jgi:hypothetical protein
MPEQRRIAVLEEAPATPHPAHRIAVPADPPPVELEGLPKIAVLAHLAPAKPEAAPRLVAAPAAPVIAAPATQGTVAPAAQATAELAAPAIAVVPPAMPIVAATPAPAIVEQPEPRADISPPAVAMFPSREADPLRFARTVRFALSMLAA